MGISKLKIPKVCEHCGKAFEARTFNNRFCCSACKDWKPKQLPKVLVIGHDPRLQQSDTIAEYALFADYYFQGEPKSKSEKQKYGLAKSTFEQILEIICGKFKPEEFYLTNLCNTALPHAPKGKTVLISEDKARAGIKHIRQILKENPTIEFIFPMSLQVNYWLQKLDFYSSDTDFVKETEPKEKGIKNTEPYFESKKSGTFLKVCGNQYKIAETQTVVPILHSKCYPFNKKFEAYQSNYKCIKNFFIVK